MASRILVNTGSGDCLPPGPCLTTAIWRCRNNFSQWECSFHWKLRGHWLEFLRQRQITVARQGPGSAPSYLGNQWEEIQLVWANKNVDIKVPNLLGSYWVFVRGATGDRYIPFTNGQWCDKHFQIMTSLCTSIFTRGQFWHSDILPLPGSVCVYQPRTCPRDNISPVQAKIAKFEPEMVGYDPY